MTEMLPQNLNLLHCVRRIWTGTKPSQHEDQLPPQPSGSREFFTIHPKLSLKCVKQGLQTAATISTKFRVWIKGVTRRTTAERTSDSSNTASEVTSSCSKSQQPCSEDVQDTPSDNSQTLNIPESNSTLSSVDTLDVSLTENNMATSSSLSTTAGPSTDNLPLMCESKESVGVSLAEISGGLVAVDISSESTVALVSAVSETPAELITSPPSMLHDASYSADLPAENNGIPAPSLETIPCLTDPRQRGLVPEVLLRIFEYLIPHDELPPTLEVLLNVKNVCQQWRRVADQLVWRSLVGHWPLFALRDGQSPQDQDRQQLRARFKKASTLPPGTLLDTVSFALELKRRPRDIPAADITDIDITDFEINNINNNSDFVDSIDFADCTDTKLAEIFVNSLTQCRKARITLYLPPANLPNPLKYISRGNVADVEQLVAVTHDMPQSFHEFSWSASQMGIWDALPWRLGLPWLNLAKGIAWGQLTKLELDCQLSLGDCYFVLSSGKASLQRVLLDSVWKDDLTIASPSPPQSKCLLALHSLVIGTSVDLGPLFRRLYIPSLKTFEVRARVPDVKLSPTTGDKRSLTAFSELGIPWDHLVYLALDSYAFRDCPLNHILYSCPNLEHLEWNGFVRNLQPSIQQHVSEPPLFKNHCLKTLGISSDLLGCDYLLRTFSKMEEIHTLHVSQLSPFLSEAIIGSRIGRALCPFPCVKQINVDNLIGWRDINLSYSKVLASTVDDKVLGDGMKISCL